MTLRTFLLMLTTVTITGCGVADPEQVKVCESQLKDKLKSPASYKRISADRIDIDASIHKPPYDQVTITYDAANSFNALLRDKETCFYHPGTTDAFDPYESDNAVDMNATDMNATTFPTNADEELNADEKAGASDDEDSPADPPFDDLNTEANYPENDAGE